MATTQQVTQALGNWIAANPSATPAQQATARGVVSASANPTATNAAGLPMYTPAGNLTPLSKSLAAGVVPSYYSGKPIDVGTLGGVTPPAPVIPPAVDTSQRNLAAMGAGISSNQQLLNNLGLSNIDANKIAPTDLAYLSILDKTARENADESRRIQEQFTKAYEPISDVNKQILDLSLQMGNINEMAQLGVSKIGDQPIAMPIIGKQQRLLLEQSAVKSNAISARIQALSGYMNSARQTIMDSLDLAKFNFNVNSENRKNMLGVVEKIGDRAEARLANEKRAEETRKQFAFETAYKSYVQAIQNASGNSQLLASISEVLPTISTDPTKALQQLSAIPGAQLVSMEDRLRQESLRLDIAKKQQELGGGIEDIPQLVAYAQQYAATGKIPTGIPKGTFGAVSQLAKELPKAKGEIVSKSTGIAPDTLGAAGDAYAALYSATELAKQLKELDEKRWGGLVAGTIGKVFGSSDQSRYVDLREQIVDLLSRARSGAALTANEEARYSGMLPGRFTNPLGIGADSQVRIGNFIDTLSSDLKNKLNTKGWAMYGITNVNIGGQDYVAGDIIQNAAGQRGRINPDGSITLLQ